MHNGENLGGSFENELPVDVPVRRPAWDELTLGEQRDLVALHLDAAIRRVASFCGRMLQNVGAWRNRELDDQGN